MSIWQFSRYRNVTNGLIRLDTLDIHMRYFSSITGQPWSDWLTDWWPLLKQAHATITQEKQ